MVHFLPHLDLRFPKMWRVCFLAIFTLLVLYIEFDNHSLLQQSFVEDLLLNSQPDFKPLGMWLGPNETRIPELKTLSEVFDLLQAMTQQLRRFGFQMHPWWFFESITLFAMINSKLLWQVSGDVNFRFEALDASIGSVWRHHDATHAASNFLGLKNGEVFNFLVILLALSDLSWCHIQIVDLGTSFHMSHGVSMRIPV